LIRKNAAVGEQIEVTESVKEFGRVAAQTAKQVILQRLREAERDVVMAEFEDKIGSVINAIVSRVEGSIVRLEIGKAQGIMPRSEQIQGEHYHSGQRLKVYLKDVERGLRGPQLIVSRGSAEFMRWLFSNEVPELESGAVEIKKIAREAGVRTKLAVASSAPGVDPVGTFVGGHGTRVNAVISEIGEQEKIDIVVYDDDSEQFIVNALSPTKVSSIKIEGNLAKVIVPSDQLSVAIGRGGQNVRLASKLTGFEIDVSADNAARATQEEVKPEPEVSKTKPAESVARPRLKKKTELENSLLEAIDEQDK
jgi:N utilization substance protein A